jgi:cytochrome P450
MRSLSWHGRHALRRYLTVTLGDWCYVEHAMSSELKRPPGPGPVTKNPLSLLAYAQRMRRGVAERIGERFELYGDIYYAPFLGRDVYVFRHPAHLHEILIAQADKFAKPSEGVTARQLRRLLGEGLLVSNGALWRKQRRLIQPAFRKERIEEYASVVVEHVEEQLASYRDGQQVDVSREMMELTLRIVCKALFDQRVKGETERVARAMRVFRSSFASFDALLPEWLPTPGKQRALTALADVDAIIYELIDRPRSASGRDLLNALKTSAEADGAAMSRRQLRDELVTLFIAGHETTSHALSWTFHLLGRNPEVARKLHAELDTVLAGRTPSLADLERLPYLEQVLCESMRLYPPAYVVSRVAAADAELGGYVIPRGADVILWLYHTQRDARWYPDPERFEPERFAPANRKQLPSCAYLPFGAGTRICIGKQFAMMEALLVLACVAQRFTLSSESSGEIGRDMSVTLAPRGGLPMRLHARPPLAAPLTARA